MVERLPIRVAAVQISPDLDTVEGAVARVLAALEEAADKGARLVVFPETFVPWYPYFAFLHPPMMTGSEHIRLYENAVVVPGPVTDAVAAVAKRRGVVVVLGVTERDHGSLYNAQLIFDNNGHIVLKRRKITPAFHERMIWGQGDGSGLTAVDTATESLAYYVVQVEKFAFRYETLVRENGEANVREWWDASDVEVAEEFLAHAAAIKAER